MMLSTWVERLQHQLRSVARFGDSATQQTAEQLVDALTPALRSALTDAVSELIADHNATTESSPLLVSLQGDEIRLTSLESPDATATPIDSDRSARIALRLPNELKKMIDDAAAAAGVSTNTWIVNTLHSRTTPRTPQIGNRLRGSGRA